MSRIKITSLSPISQNLSFIMGSIEGSYGVIRIKIASLSPISQNLGLALGSTEESYGMSRD